MLINANDFVFDATSRNIVCYFDLNLLFAMNEDGEFLSFDIVIVNISFIFFVFLAGVVVITGLEMMIIFSLLSRKSEYFRAVSFGHD